MKNLFNSISVRRHKSSTFDLSHDVKLSCNMGDLVPTLVLECVPGDKFHIGCESLGRFAPLVAPMMHRVDVTMHYWFVPNRILWRDWERFMAAGDPQDASVPVAPHCDIDNTRYTKLADYLGLPIPDVANTEQVSALPFAAYQCIYDHFYRDQNLIASDFVNADGSYLYLIDGANNDTNLWKLRKRAWEHDYFTSALPWPQRGAPGITVPFSLAHNVKVKMEPGSVPADTLEALTGTSLPSSTPQVAGAPIGASSIAGIGAGELWAETTGLTGSNTSINDLRRAMRLQEWFEAMARGGSRYAELIWNMFGVRVGDYRLQRPEYITGTKSPFVVSEVLQTSETATTPQGTMAGHGVSVTSGRYGFYKVREHGFIIGIMSVMPKTAYQEGIARLWLKTDPISDYFWHQFENIGEQAIYKKELYAYQGASGDTTFGYTPRYAEYKFQLSRVAGDFRTTLDFWHMARQFGASTPLDAAFVECNPTYRVFAVDDGGATDHLWMHILHKIRAIRPMQRYGTPHF